jgi:acyl-[acyl-carrier-protein] desaturase
MPRAMVFFTALTSTCDAGSQIPEAKIYRQNSERAAPIDTPGIQALECHRQTQIYWCNHEIQIIGVAMSADLPNIDLLRALEPVAEKLINRHMSMTKDWNPHDYIPWSDGKNYYALGGEDWDPDQAKLSEVARVAMVQNLLTEDNLPAYHREIAMNFSMDSPWGYWVNRWTAEENRHGIAIRDYLVVTRNCDPVELEELRMEQMTRGFSPGQNQQGDLFAEGLFDAVMYVSFQELATRVSHRNTGKACNEPVAEQLLARISNDENLHMIFYRDVSAAGLDIAPNQAIKSVHRILHNFKMPGYTVPEFRRKAVIIATGGVYDPRIHLEDVVMPILKKWRIFERDDFTGEGARMRDELGTLIEDLEQTCVKFEDAKARKLDRDAKLAEKRAAKSVLAAAAS